MPKITQIQIFNPNTKAWDILNSRVVTTEKEKDEIQKMKDGWERIIFKDHKLRIHTF